MIVNLFFLSAMLYRLVGGFQVRRLRISLGKVTGASLAMALAVAAVHQGASIWLGPGLVGQVVALFSVIFLGVAVYAGLILFLQVPEARDLLEQVRGRKG